MAFKNYQVDGFVQEAVAALSPRQAPYVKIVIRSGDIVDGKTVYTYYTCFVPGHMFQDLATAQRFAARYTAGRHILVSGRPRFDISPKTSAGGYPLSAANWKELNEKCRVNVALDVVGVPELLS